MTLSAPSAPRPVGAMLVDSAGRPAVTITPYALNPTTLRRPVALQDETRKAILALLRAAPGVALAIQGGAGGAYAIRFAPHVAAQLAGGQASMMRAVDGGVRAMAVNGQGQIVAHGTLVPLSGVSPAMAALGIWQALAVITAQHYLADIQRQLQQIAGAVATLRLWHEDRELGRIVSDHAYLARTRDLLLAGPVSDVERGAIIGQLEQVEREAGLIVAARRQSLTRADAQARAVPLGSPVWWAVEQNAAQLTQYIHTAAADLQMLGLGLGLQAADLQMLGLGLGLQAAAAQTQAALLGRGRKGSDLLASVVTGAHDARMQWCNLATAMHERTPEIFSVSDVRRVGRNLQARIALEIDAATAVVVPRLGALEAAASAAQPQRAAPQLVVQVRPEGAITAYMIGPVEDLPAETPAPDLCALAAVRHLQITRGMVLASWDDLPQASERFRLRDGTSVRDFTNFVGFRHVFLVAPSGTCLFGGFSPPTHAGDLRQSLAEIRALLAV